jgi:micrococcal nuclease
VARRSSAALLAFAGLVVLVTAALLVGRVGLRDASWVPGAAGGPDAGGRSEAPRVSDRAGDAGRPVRVPADAEAAIVERIVDGDTLRVVAAPGSPAGAGGSVRVRLLNLDAPELARDGAAAECLADEAAARLAALLPPGSLVWLAGDVDREDRHGRLLRAAWTEEGRFVNEVLVAEGLATALLVRPNDRFHADLLAAERHARAAQVGLWGEACPEVRAGQARTSQDPTSAARSPTTAGSSRLRSAATRPPSSSSRTVSYIAVEKVV